MNSFSFTKTLLVTGASLMTFLLPVFGQATPSSTLDLPQEEECIRAFLSIKQMPADPKNIQIAKRVLPYLLNMDTHLFSTFQNLQGRDIFKLNVSALFFTLDLPLTPAYQFTVETFISYVMTSIIEHNFPWVHDHIENIQKEYIDQFIKEPVNEQITICQALCNLFDPNKMEGEFYQRLLGKDHTLEHVRIASSLFKGIYQSHWGFLPSAFPYDSSDEEEESVA